MSTLLESWIPVTSFIQSRTSSHNNFLQTTCHKNINRVTQRQLNRIFTISPYLEYNLIQVYYYSGAPTFGGVEKGVHLYRTQIYQNYLQRILLKIHTERMTWLFINLNPPPYHNKCQVHETWFFVWCRSQELIKQHLHCRKWTLIRLDLSLLFLSAAICS